MADSNNNPSTMTGTSINISNLDFDAIKNDLKTYLRSQPEFKDFDFEGSAMNILLDILSVNTHYQGWYSHMALAESFLDTATTRDGIVSHAKLLGYTPKSKTASRAFVNINFGQTRPTINGDTFDYLPLGTIFQGKSGRETFYFISRQPYELVIDSTGTYIINDIEIIEGDIRVINYIFDETNGDQRFLIPDQNVDMSTLVVRIQASVQNTSGSTDVWKLNTDYSSLGSDSLVYFTEETENGLYRVYFGDGIIGRKPRNGNFVTIQYLVTNGPLANGLGRADSPTSRTFTALGFPNSVVSVASPASGGAERESVDRIRYNAPRAFQAQERAVTAEDYRSILEQVYSGAESVHVYGGEDADPPQYGKVFVAIKPFEGVSLTDVEKRNLARNVLAKRNVLGIIPEIVDPDVIYLNATIRAIYDPAKTSGSSNSIALQIRDAVYQYSTEFLNQFDRTFVHSHFMAYLDKANVAIIGNETDIVLEKRVNVNLGQAISYEIDFNNSLFHPEEGYKPIVSSTSFFYLNGGSSAAVESYLDDDGTGNLRVYTILNGQKVITKPKAGTIDYTTGKLNLLNFSPTGLIGQTDTINIKVVPEMRNIESKRNTILVFDESDMGSATITVSAKNITTKYNTNTGVPFPFST